MNANVAIVIGLLALVPVALYAFFVGVLSHGVAGWARRILRPLLLMLLFAPGVLSGHGIAILPAGAAVYFALASGPPHSEQATDNVLTWLVYAFLGFLFECWLAWRRMKQESLLQEAERQERQRERIAALDRRP